MKKTLLSALLLTLTYSMASAQTPGTKWSRYKTFVDTWPNDDVVFDAKQTSDHGFILAGLDSNFFINKYDLLAKGVLGLGCVARFDSAGNRLWIKKPTGQSLRSAYTSVQETSDGGFIAAGYFERFSPLDSGVVIITKFTAGGQIVWHKEYGGSKQDQAYSIVAIAGGGYLVAGSSFSNDGQVSGNHGSADAWVMRIDNGGDPVWQKSFGGTGIDIANTIIQTGANGFIIVGSSVSVNGDLTGNHGFVDGWIFKIDGAGNLLWQKNVGGSGIEVIKNIAATEDGGYILTGYTDSQNGDVSGNHGTSDLWLLKIDQSGNITWSKCFGGSLEEFGLTVQRTLNNEFLVGGFTESTNGDISGSNGVSEIWTVLVSANGDLIWQKCSGTNVNEYGAGALYLHGNEYMAIGFGKRAGSNPFDGSDIFFSLLGNTNTIKGTVFLDANANGVKDVGEKNFDDITVKVTAAGFTGFAIPKNGQFKLETEIGTYTSTVQLNLDYYVVTPTSHNSVFPTYFNTDSFSFAIQPLPLKNDLRINIVPLSPIRPGFNASYKIIYRNAGTVTINSTAITLQKSAALTNVVLSNPAPSTNIGNTLTWLTGNLAPMDSGSINVTFTVATPPAINIGDTSRIITWIDPVAGDLTPADDTAVLKQIITGSYDPNDKTEANAGRITQAQVTSGDYLNYLIRFQNTGNDTAFTVYVRDTLNAKLDWNSFQMTGASHTYNLQISDDDKITWTFSDIKLPDSNINEPRSHGYIAYRIKPKPTVVVGDVIPNTAGIYFDFNLPVATNNAQTIVFNFTGLPVNLVSFKASLVGSAVDVSWKTAAENNARHFEIQRSTNGVDFVTIGTVKAGNSPSGQSYLFKDGSPVKGYNYYRLKSVDIDGAFKYSAIVLVNVTDGVDVLTSLYPNPSSGHIVLKLQGAIKGKVNVSVMDHVGQEVLNKKYGSQNTNQWQTTLELGSFAKGSYIIRISLNDSVYIHKLLIQ